MNGQSLEDIPAEKAAEIFSQLPMGEITLEVRSKTQVSYFVGKGENL